MSAVTIIIVIIVVIILFTYFYHMYKNWKKTKKKHTWPPEVLPCPDYWVNQGNGICKNPYGLGLSDMNGTFKTGPIDSVDFTKQGGGVCQKPKSRGCLDYKAKWATGTQNPWFGVRKGCHKNPGNCYSPA